MRGAARDGTPPGVLQGARSSRMPGMAQGSRWHESLTLNKRLAVVPGLDPSLLKAETAARLREVIDYTLSCRKNIANEKVLSVFSIMHWGYSHLDEYR